MKNHYLSLLSVPALAIAVMASAASEVEAQCSKGCFGYPTPSQTFTRSYVPTAQYRVLPTQTFVQPTVFAAPEYLPVQNYSPVQPQVFEPAPQFVPSAPIVQPMPIASVPEQHPRSSLSAEVYIPPTEVVEPNVSVEIGPVTPLEIPVPPVADPVDFDPADEMKRVQEGEIEAEIISPASDDLSSSTSEEKAEMEKAEEKAGKKVLTEQERIAKLEASLQRQIKRAKQRSAKKLLEKLSDLEADGDVSQEKIDLLKQESADALKARLAEIEKRVQARIDQLKE